LVDIAKVGGVVDVGGGAAEPHVRLNIVLRLIHCDPPQIALTWGARVTFLELAAVRSVVPHRQQVTRLGW
jgi:hypothetical protein